MPHNHKSQDKIKRCASICADCSAICSEINTYCICEGGEYADKSHTNILLDCARISQACADAISEGSDNAPALCKSCVEVCNLCAESCKKFSNDEKIKECGKLCLRCAENCLELVTE